MFSLQLETMSTSVGHLKYVMRACLTNQDGDRLLDTLIAPPDLPKGVNVTQPKEGIKKRMIGLAKEIGPTVKDVAHVICHFVKGKMLTGYHVPMKLQDLGLMNVIQLPPAVLEEKKERDLEISILSQKFATPVVKEVKLKK
jgi:hypothetical protein